MLDNNKTNSNLKTCLNKVKVLEQKHQAKPDKACKKAQEKAQINDIRRFVIGNKQINTFKNVLSDLVSISSSNPSNFKALVPILITRNIQLVNKINVLR